MYTSHPGLLVGPVATSERYTVLYRDSLQLQQITAHKVKDSRVWEYRAYSEIVWVYGKGWSMRSQAVLDKELNWPQKRLITGNKFVFVVYVSTSCER